MKRSPDKEEVHQKLGKNPDITGVVTAKSAWPEAVEYEIYYVKGPVYSPIDELTNRVQLGLTWGLLEFISFPYYTVERLSGFYATCTLLFVYDENGIAKRPLSRRGRKTPAELHL